MKRILIIQGHSNLKSVTAEDVAAALLPSERDALLEHTALDTREFSNEIESGYWEQVNAELRQAAGTFLEKAGGGEIRYFGIEEVPIAVALGAYLSDEHTVECRDWDRDKGVFRWPDDTAPVDFEIVGAPREDIVGAAGDVVVRVELTSPVTEDDIDSVVARASRTAEIVIRPSEGRPPKPSLIRSARDLDNYKAAIRTVMASIDKFRPNTQVIHLFVAGPVSAAIATGQALRLRNGRPVQTYRFRAGAQPRMQAALLLSPAAPNDSDVPLSEADRTAAKSARETWKEALRELNDHAKQLKVESAADGGKWPRYLSPKLSHSYRGPTDLPPIWDLASDGDGIAEKDCEDFHFDGKSRSWHLGDRMMLMMHRAAGGDSAKLLRFGRAFLWHEYLHSYQLLTRYLSPGVGRFANCLERVDYIADLYSILHQVDFELRISKNVASDEQLVSILARVITEAIDSFWTFEPTPPNTRIQQRRLRRYLNWYWRREQVQHQTNLNDAVALLSNQPTIEIAGLPISTDRTRVFLDLNKVEKSEQLEIGIVSERNKFIRCSESTTLSVAQMLKAFSQHDRTAIDNFFAQLYEHVRD